MKISFPFFFALKLLLRLFKYIVFQRQERPFLKNKANIFSSYFVFPFHFQNYFKYSKISRKDLSCVFRGHIIHTRTSNYHFLISKISSWDQKICFFVREIFRCSKNKTKKEVKKYGLGIIGCITSNI